MALNEGLPTVVTTSVIRSTSQGESHGGVYLVDLQKGTSEQVIDWDDSTIDWEGRGADRGLRGIAFYDGHVILAASDEVFVYDPGFTLIESYRNRYLKHCHEIFISGSTLFLTSTGFDSILEFDLTSGSFTRGYELRFGLFGRAIRSLGGAPIPRCRVFDPNRDGGPGAGDTIHLNNVWHASGELLASGRQG